MRATDIIIKKRGIKSDEDSVELSKEEIEFIIKGCVDGSIPEYQISSFLMAVYFRGMTFKEIGFLTEAMLHSGDVINFHKESGSGLIGPFIDKHSTGGVGDKISIPLAPMAACCSLQIPMMSGRALGHTGGTLDKLESIDGYKTNITEETFKKLIAKTGYAMTGQTEKIAPADRKLYALRDVTGTVESIPLITASILSKKIAEGADGLVFDVKWGSGAFMKTMEDADLLANSLVKTAQSMGKSAYALITDMNTPLGNKIGNFLEIEESIECLQGNAPMDVMEELYALGARMLVLGKKANSIEDAIKQCKLAISSGHALEKFLQNVEDQGGNPDKLMSQIGKRRSKFRREIQAEKDGYICIDAYKTGTSCITLGVGRNKTTDMVCPDAGIILYKRHADKVCAGETIMEIFAKDEKALEEGCKSLITAISYSENAVSKNPLICREIN